MIRKVLTSLLALAVALPLLAIDIVPNPVSVKEKKGVCLVSSDYDGSAAKTVISSKMAPEEYRLVISGSGVKITAGSDAGIFRARQTLAQIIAQSPIRKNGRRALGCVDISDRPAFGYRGAHLDCCRHFFSVDEVKRFIDIIALHKLNVFHWHLTDDQGWRIQIDKYPRLTEVGSIRERTAIGHYSFDMIYDGTPYGGFYTKDELREVVAYAAQRHITVIPEIEMPGHSVAALTAYPWLGCMQGGYHVRDTWGVSKEVLCLGRESTYKFLEDVLDEVLEIFPSEYIHIGGDEAPHDYWDICPECQKVMAENGYTRPYQLQGHLVNRIEMYLNERGRKMIGWDEILMGDISTTATVMSWRGAEGGIEAAKRGNTAIMAPYTHFYLDFYQTADPEANGEPLAIGGHTNLERVYSFDPYDKLSEEEKGAIIGLQANTWTEYIATFDHVEYMVLPRLSALAEDAWSAKKTSYGNFLGRVTRGLKPIYDERGYNYATYAFEGIE